MTVRIKDIVTTTSTGVSFTLTGKASLNGGMSTDVWWVSWDKIGKALFKEQYSTEEQSI